MRPPVGVSEATIGSVLVWSRPEVLPWAQQAIATSGSLHLHAARNPRVHTRIGRGAVHLIPSPLESPTGDRRGWAVRQFLRGGAARWLGDRHVRIGQPRPFAEWVVSDFLRSKGVPTPTVRAAAMRRTGLVYRGEIVTDYVDDGIELANLLFDEHPDAPDHLTPDAAIAASSALIDAIAGAGVYHPDINARNVLLRPDGERWSAVVLDLDRCRLGADRSGRDAMRARLVRSIAKIGRSAGRAVPAGALNSLEGA